ncbi:MAG: LysR family transcriptional regulator [Firmicutes bacterium]|nr:LysR family transcriptional regulator [Bacillota bacterium]
MSERVNAEVFLTVAELGSYRKAADKLGFTQAGISYIINAMEKETGLKLFAREYGGVHLTVDGENLLPWVRQLYNSEQALSERVRELTHLDSGRIRVISFNSVQVKWLPGIIRRFHRDYPEIEIELVSCERFRETEALIDRGDADLGFIVLPAERNLYQLPLSEQPVLAAFPPEHPFAQLSSIPAAALGNYPYIGPPLAFDPSLMAYLQEHEVTLKTAFTTENDDARLALVSQNLGYTIYTGLMLEDHPFSLRYAPLDPPLLWTYGLIAKSEETLSAAARTFMKYAADWVRGAD